MAYKMMDEVVHYCTKCKMDLNHRIILMEKGRPKRVLCLTCKTDRQFHLGARPKRPTSSKSPKTSKGRQEAEWFDKLHTSRKVPKPYGFESVFAREDLLQHKLFGVGLVVGHIPPDKVQVYFLDGVKTLKCGK